MCLRALLVLLMTGPVLADSQVYRTDGAVVEYDGIGEAYAAAIARTASLARKAAGEQFGFDMPDSVSIRVSVDPKRPLRLYTDGDRCFFLDLPAEDKLRPSPISGVFTIYGFCHETAHIAQYRLIRDHSWQTTDAAEAWAHYLGSRLVDIVYEQAGQELWPQPYDYRSEGMQRLNRQLQFPQLNDRARAAKMWLELMQIIGDEQIAPLFAAWDQAQLDPQDPGAALRAALLNVHGGHAIEDWWNSAEQVLVFKQPRSGFAARTVNRKDLSGKGEELKHDDGQAAGKRSIAGSGHAVSFDVVGDSWYLTDVAIFASRYGMPQPPKENFQVWLCDEQGQVIRQFDLPYASFQRGAEHWVRLPLEPTQVPPHFMVVFGFNATATKGVYVSHDDQMDGDSRTGLPGRMGSSPTGDWMIRALVDQPRSADALQEK
ncbi:MAG: hypothetical protein IT445_15565 [Phycisphaeraceae bacterium]|nr:hypothetical protein [Phycisphaeraceae bacterium]